MNIHENVIIHWYQQFTPLLPVFKRQKVHDCSWKGLAENGLGAASISHNTWSTPHQPLVSPLYPSSTLPTLATKAGLPGHESSRSLSLFKCPDSVARWLWCKSWPCSTGESSAEVFESSPPKLWCFCKSDLNSDFFFYVSVQEWCLNSPILSIKCMIW